MIGKADWRRPLAVAIVSIVAIGAALVAPVVIGPRHGGSISGSAVRAESGASVVISAPLALFDIPFVTVEKGTVSLVGAESESRVGALFRALVRGDGVDLVVDGARFVVDRTEASAPGAAPASQAAGDAASMPAATAHTSASGELGSIVSALADFKFRTLTLMNSSIVVKTAQGTREKLSNVTLEVAPDGRGLVKAKGRLRYRNEPLDVDIAFTRPSSEARAGAVQIRAAVKGKYVSAAFDGRLGPGERAIVAPNAELAVSDLRGAASWLGFAWPQGSGLGPFSAKGQLALDDRTITFEQAEFGLDGNAAAGALTARIGAERPAIEGTLAFANFDISPYVAPSRPYALALVSDWLSSVRFPGFAASSVLAEVDADLRISAHNVVSGSDRLGRIAASVSVKAGKVYGEVAELELEPGGSGEGQFTLDVTGQEPRYTVRADLNDVDLNTLVAARLGPAALDGAGDLRLDVHATGASEADLLRSLGGTVALDMKEGGRIGVDLDALAAAAAEPRAGQWQHVSAGSTSVSGFTVRLTAEDGVMTADAVEAALDGRKVTASGSADLGRQAVDLMVSVGSSGAGGAPEVYKIHGPWPEPAIQRVEPGKAARNVAPGSDPG